MKKIFYSLLLFITISTFASCEKIEDVGDLPGYSTDYYTYKIRGSNGIDIGELTFLGKKQNIIIIPSSIDGIKVAGVGLKMKLFMMPLENTETWITGALEKVYVPYFSSSRNLPCVFDEEDFFPYGVRVFHLDVEDNLNPISKPRINFLNTDFLFRSIRF